MKIFVLFLFLSLMMMCSVQAEKLIVFLETDESSVPAMSPDMANRADVLNAIRSQSDQSFGFFLGKVRNLRNFRTEKFYWSIAAIAVDGNKEELENIPGVKAVMKDVIEYPEKTVPSDRTVETEGDEYTYGLKNMNVPRAWKELNAKGQGVLVGIIDTGLDGKHQEFKDTGKVVKYYDGLSSASLDSMTDSHGHGSHVAGTIAGGNLSGKHIGVAPECKLIIAKGISSKGTRGTELLEAMEWMIDPDGNPSTNDFPRVVNCSWHSGYGDASPYYAMIDRWLTVGIIPAFSAGNSGPGSSTITKPKEYPKTFATGALDENKKIASFSSRGPGKYNGTDTAKPDWASPGVDIYSVKANGQYRTMSGTSMASPHTAGTIALMLSVRPALGPEDVREILKQACTDAGDPGFDYTYGNGILDAYEACRLAKLGGFAEGTVKNIDGAKAEILVKETGKKVQCSPDGKYRIMLSEGSYTLVATAFGYMPREERVTVRQASVTTRDFYMSEAPRIRISGKVTAKGDSEGIQAKLTIPGTGVSTESNTSGYFEFSITAGRYAFNVSAFGFNTLEVPEKNFSSSETVNFALEPLPPVIIVADDKGKGEEANYKKALDALKIKYNVHRVSTDGDITESVILPYHLVIWMTGSSTSDTISDNDAKILTAYLGSGGRLFASGQDIGYNIKTKEFYGKFLHAKYLKDKSSTLSITGDRQFKIEGGSGANNQKYADVIEALDGAEVIYRYGADEVAAVKYTGTYRIVYFAFGYEAIDTDENRKAVMQDICDFLLPSAEDKILRYEYLKTMEFSDKDTGAKIINAYEDSVAQDIFELEDEEISDIYVIFADYLEGKIKEAVVNKLLN